MKLSTLPHLELVPTVFATIFIGFGILWFVNPAVALSFFELPYPAEPTPTAPPKTRSGGKAPTPQPDARKTIDPLSVAYGARDIFMGLAIYAAALCGTREALGWIVAAAGGVAAVDGAVCKFMVGKGEMNHWSYAPVLILLGGVILGAFDWVPV